MYELNKAHKRNAQQRQQQRERNETMSGKTRCMPNATKTEMNYLHLNDPN